MKLNDTYYYCFGCGANGDAIDLTSKLFDLNPRQAAEKLIHDFGLDPDKPPANAIALPPPKRGLTDEQWADIAYCLRVLTDYLDLLHDCFQFQHRQMFNDALFHLLQPVVIAIQDFLCMGRPTGIFSPLATSLCCWFSTERAPITA